MNNVTTSTLLEQQNEYQFDRHDDFFMDYMSFKKLCNVFAIIIPTFIIWELFIFLVYVNKSNQDRFNHCAGPRYLLRCLAYLCMCVGLVCYGRYAINQYSIERYNYYGPMDIISSSNNNNSKLTSLVLDYHRLGNLGLRKIMESMATTRKPSSSMTVMMPSPSSVRPTC